MDLINCVFFITISIWKCDGVSLRKQLEHIALRRRESLGIPVADFLPSRRYYDFHPSRSSVILGAPSMASHLPEAEPILPGHTLIRPSLDMLKSSVKFPHKDMDDGAGVYGNIDNLSIRWDGRNDRVLYTGFRRRNDGETMADSMSSRRNNEEESSYGALLTALLRSKQRKKKPRRVEKDNGKRNIGVYQSAYSPKGSKPKIIEINFEPMRDKLVKQLMNHIRKKLGTKSRTENQGQSNIQRQRSTNKSPRTRASNSYAYLNLDHLDEVLRENPTWQNYRENKEMAMLWHHSDDNLSDDVHVDSSDLDIQQLNHKDNVDNDSKLAWFWNLKDAYNHIKINPEAPQFADLMPVQNTDDSKKWWFYHEADFEPLEKL